MSEMISITLAIHFTAYQIGYIVCIRRIHHVPRTIYLFSTQLMIREMIRAAMLAVYSVVHCRTKAEKACHETTSIYSAEALIQK